MRTLKAILGNGMTYHSLLTSIVLITLIVMIEQMKLTGVLITDLMFINVIVYLGQASMIYITILCLKELIKICKNA